MTRDAPWDMAMRHSASIAVQASGRRLLKAVWFILLAAMLISTSLRVEENPRTGCQSGGSPLPDADGQRRTLYLTEKHHRHFDEPESNDKKDKYQ